MWALLSNLGWSPRRVWLWACGTWWKIFSHFSLTRTLFFSLELVVRWIDGSMNVVVLIDCVQYPRSIPSFLSSPWWDQITHTEFDTMNDKITSTVKFQSQTTNMYYINVWYDDRDSRKPVRDVEVEVGKRSFDNSPAANFIPHLLLSPGHHVLLAFLFFFLFSSPIRLLFFYSPVYPFLYSSSSFCALLFQRYSPVRAIIGRRRRRKHERVSVLLWAPDNWSGPPSSPFNPTWCEI